MTIKTTINLDEEQHAFLVKQVKDGTYASLDEAIASAVEEMRELSAPADPEMVAEIQRRLQTPEADYLTWDGKKIMDEVRQSLAETTTATK